MGDDAVNHLAKELTMEMIPERYRHVAELIGVDNLLKLAEYVHGDEFYIPAPAFFLRPVRDQKIRNEYNGRNHHELAKKYGLNERTIREICEGLKPEPEVDDRQLTLFDLG